MRRDVRAAEQVRRRQNEISKNPNFGRKQTLDYLFGICAEHESTKDLVTKKDLQMHFEHYDRAFKVICVDVCRCKTAVQDVKDAFLERRRRTMPYISNPFEERRPNRFERRSSSETRLIGADAFPSQVTMMKIGEMAKSSTATQQQGSFQRVQKMFLCLEPRGQKHLCLCKRLV
ncbi:unnamed protein product [Gongylonema pulchrum]|uniref:Uncharacterized protein n=1 Tax=Gongylonema pulchrum TaxID=637853 RepID=A0A183EIA2_9BILA|nr:unnamed protein product [Gongylonema pulchrum]